MGATVDSDGSVTKTLSNCWGCANCWQLVYCDNWNDDDHIGVCPSGGKHKAGCAELKLMDTGAGESGYKFCTRCASIYLSTSAVSGKCSGGSAHSPDTSTFTLKSEKRDKNVTYSNAWSRCKKCACLFMIGGTSNGSCFKGGSHDADGDQVFTCTQKVNRS